MTSDVLALFLELAAIPSPPGEERAVADVVTSYLRDCGLEVDEDNTGPETGSQIGNLYTRIEPTAEGVPIFFCAHLDTVPPDGPLEPVVDDGVVLVDVEAEIAHVRRNDVGDLALLARRTAERGQLEKELEYLRLCGNAY